MEYKKIFIVNGGDKKSLDKYYKSIDIILMNANIAEHFKKSMTSWITTYNFSFMIDPMTYMIQAKKKALVSKTTGKLKTSIAKVFKEFYGFNDSKIEKYSEGTLDLLELAKTNIESFISNIYEYQVAYAKQDLGVFGASNKAKWVSSPYLDIQVENTEEILKLNRQFISDKRFNMTRVIFSEFSNIEKTIRYINNDIEQQSNIKYLEIWIESNLKSETEKIISKIRTNKKLLFKFVGWNDMEKIEKAKLKSKTIGFITAFGFGESRNIYPVGGGLPVNKVYLKEEHRRLDVDEFLSKVAAKSIKFIGPNLKNDNNYLDKICKCSVCKDLIAGAGVSAIYLFSEFNEYERKLVNGMTSKRKTATQKAQTISNWHYVENKLMEYKEFFLK